MKELKGSVQGMDCADCVLKIKKTLSQIDGVKSVELNLVSTKLFVAFDERKLDKDIIVKKIRELGYGFSMAYQKQSFFNIKSNKSLQTLLIATGFFLLALIFGKFYPFNYYYLLYVLSFLIGGIPIYKKAWY